MPRNKKGRPGRKNTPNAGSSAQTTQSQRPVDSAASDIVMGSTEPATPIIPSITPAVEASSSSTSVKQVSEQNASQSNAAEPFESADSAQPRAKKAKIEEEDEKLPPLVPPRGSGAPTPSPSGALLLPESPPESDMSSNEALDYDDPDDSDSDSESIEGRPFKAMARQRTRKYVNAFLDKGKDKHFVDMKIDPLLGCESYYPWVFAIEIQLKMHQVWEVVEDDLCPLSKTDDLYIWYERMKDVACAVIYANVGQTVRKNGCFINTMKSGDPTEVMSHLYSHYGHFGDEIDGPNESDGSDELD
ncbi:hypothetical protein N7478_002842 [Penicillium angulare]|uniref:uncharacterized protein n=1 Tax=Penicillium angulare TaxID=116970 RepID=UPI0025426803|nr:uncharacterized protein N7478_002842 [Penicillium angulare]KAJ5287156.1 hypothetical protein N7478_002842 [Penicillium angulare]